MSLDDSNSIPPEQPVVPQPSSGTVSVLPQDLRAPWDWLDLLLLACLAIAGSFLAGWLLSVVYAVFGVSLTQLRASPSKNGLFTIARQALLFVGLLGYLTA